MSVLSTLCLAIFNDPTFRRFGILSFDLRISGLGGNRSADYFISVPHVPHKDAGSVLNGAILCIKIYTMPLSLPRNDAASVDISNGFSLPPMTLASVVSLEAENIKDAVYTSRQRPR